MSNRTFLTANAHPRTYSFLISAFFLAATFTSHAEEQAILGTVVEVISNNMLILESADGKRLYVKIENSRNDRLENIMPNEQVAVTCTMRGDLCVSSQFKTISKQNGE